MSTPSLQHVLTQRPLGLVLDIDGTLSPIVPTPDEAQLYPGVADLLKRARNYAHIAIMTGRGIDDGARLVNVDSITYIGTHGLEWSEGLPSHVPVQIDPEALHYVEPGKQLLELAKKELSDLPVIIQQKRVGGTVHYRLCPDGEQARQRILAVLTEPARQAHMQLSEGKKVVEIKVPLKIDKGEALRRFVQRLQLQGVLFAGDDTTDIDALREIRQLRQQGVVALGIGVQHHDTLPELFAEADLMVQEVAGMAHLLQEIVETLEKQQ